MNDVIYLVKGYVDAINEEDWFQCIGINTKTFEIVDKEKLIFESDLPDNSYVFQDWENILENYKMKAWRLQ